MPAVCVGLPSYDVSPPCLPSLFERSHPLPRSWVVQWAGPGWPPLPLRTRRTLRSRSWCTAQPEETMGQVLLIMWIQAVAGDLKMHSET